MTKRYEKQSLVKQIGEENQSKIQSTSITVIGVGALGSMVAELAARSGVKKITLIDFDIVELSNLQRQHLFDEQDIGKNKAEAAKDKLAIINSEIEIDIIKFKLEQETISVLRSDFIFECTDDMKTKFLTNDFCLGKSVPCIIGAVAGVSGYIIPVKKNESSVRDIFNISDIENYENVTAKTEGVLNTLTTTVSSMMFTAFLNYIAEDRFPLPVHYNAWTNDIIKLQKAED